MTHILKRAACAVIVAVLIAGCDGDATTSPTALSDLPGRVLLTLSADSAAELEALAADAGNRLVPAVAPNVALAVAPHLNGVARGLSTRDDDLARRGLDAATRALEEAGRVSIDPDLAALRLDLDALRSALEGSTPPR
jgi:hypothetical protein